MRYENLSSAVTISAALWQDGPQSEVSPYEPYAVRKSNAGGTIVASVNGLVVERV